jgi:hypothetical protein
MARKPAAISRFVVEIMVPEGEIRPTPGGVLVALEEGLHKRGYQVLVRSVIPQSEGEGWHAPGEEQPVHVTTPATA